MPVWLLVVAIGSIVGIAGTPHAAPLRHMTITCTDGGTDAVVRGRGRRITMDDAFTCDIDRTCDGVCTVRLQTGCLAWALHPVGSSPCFPPYPGYPCVSLFDRAAVVRESTTRTARRTIRQGRLRLRLRCRPCEPVTPPTKAADFTGEWRFVEASSSTTCADDLRSHFWERLWILQDGSALSAGAQGLPFCQYAGAVSARSLTMDIAQPGSIGLGCGGGVFKVAGTLAGTIGDADHVAVTERWSLLSDGRTSCAPCELSRTGTLVRRDAACATHVDCVAADACARCVDGACEWARGCDPP
jgi:hypothetical protein